MDSMCLTNCCMFAYQWHCMRMCTYSNSQLTSWVEGNRPVHVGKEDKQVKQHSYVTSLYPQYDNTIAKDCHVKLNGESVYLHGWHVADFVSNFCMFAYQWHCMTMWTCNILIVIQKLCWWRSTIWPYQPHSYMSFTLLWRCRDGWGFVYFPSLPSLFCVLLVCHLYNSL